MNGRIILKATVNAQRQINSNFATLCPNPKLFCKLVYVLLIRFSCFVFFVVFSLIQTSTSKISIKQKQISIICFIEKTSRPSVKYKQIYNPISEANRLIEHILFKKCCSIIIFSFLSELFFVL